MDNPRLRTIKENQGGGWPFSTSFCIYFITIFIVVIATIIIVLYSRFTKVEKTHDPWEIPRHDIQLYEGEIGSGSYGVVCPGILKKHHGIFNLQCTTKLCAVKILKSNKKLDFFQEVETMKQLVNSHHVIKLHGVVTKEEPYMMVMEIATNGSLYSFLRRNNIDMKRKYQMAIEIADGMAYVASHNIVHRDLAARNCLVYADLTVKVADFGMSRNTKEKDYYRKVIGPKPWRWTAPEALKGLFTNASDAWAYAVVLWEIMTNAMTPYENFTDNDVVDLVSRGYLMEIPSGCPKEMHDLMLGCWQYEPSNRPTFLQIVQKLLPFSAHSFLALSFYNTHMKLATQ